MGGFTDQSLLTALVPVSAPEVITLISTDAIAPT